MQLIQDIVIILFAAVVIIVICSRLKIPSVVGFLLTGIIIGPYTTGLIKNTHDIELLAEIGIVLMMFIIGIEFSIKKLNRIKNLILFAGGGQVVFTIIAVAAIALLFDLNFAQSLFFGFIISLSSTAIVLKLLQDKKQLDSPHGKIELAILLFQDLCVVPMVILTPILALKEGSDIGSNLLQTGIAFVSINIIFFTARKIMPFILNVIVKTRLKEIFILTSLFLCIGMAFLTDYLGLSLALGSFIAGLIISESRYSHQVVADILPFKESFNSIFFISVGMLLNVNFALTHIPNVLMFGAGIVLLKALVILIFVLFLKYPFRVAVISALGLAQAGEFSFVLAKLGLGYSILNDDMFQLFLSASILTMIFSPFAFSLSPGIATKAEKGTFIGGWLKSKEKKTGLNSQADTSKKPPEDHVIIVGYGLNGRNLAKVLDSRKIPFIIVELNTDNVKEAEKRGHNVIYGDATKRKILEEAAIKTAKVITFAISDSLVIDHAVATARFMNPKILIIARTKYVTEIDRLYELGADIVFAEEYETSIEILARVMTAYGYGKEAINRELSILHSKRYAMIRDKSTPEENAADNSRISDKINREMYAEIDIHKFTISGKCKGKGKSIAELAIRSKSGATIISVIRDEQHIPNPQADFLLLEGDTIVLMGTNEQLEKAVELMA
ncbi:MAG: cation:proton antiporter [Ignavibacteria bacterium]|nr:cation:proton antiporter [Ignavibacteria bacterium]